MRYILNKEEPAGVSIDEIITDVSKKIKISQKILGSTEAKLERLAKGVAERTFFSLSPEQQRELFAKAGIGKEQQDEFFKKLKNNKALFFPLVLSILGPKILEELIVGLVVAVIAKFSSKKVAQELLKQFVSKFPWWAEWLGPIVWALNLGWLAYDLQGPAFRKTIPSLLYLGLVCIRDGFEENEELWAEAVEGMA